MTKGQFAKGGANIWRRRALRKMFAKSGANTWRRWASIGVGIEWEQKEKEER